MTTVAASHFCKHACTPLKKPRDTVKSIKIEQFSNRGEISVALNIRILIYSTKAECRLVRG